MGQTIIYLEDDASMRNHTTELLKEKGLYIKEFRRIDQVKEYLQENSDEVVCVVTDLNMSDEWLGEYQTESDGCMLSGWVFLQRFVYPIRSDMPTVIYSGYIEYLKEWLKNNDKPKLKDLRNGRIECIDKGTDNNEGFDGLYNAIIRVIGILEEDK